MSTSLSMATSAAISATIDELLDKRSPGATICPSEVARELDPREWRALMQPVRDVAAARAAVGEIEITRGGKRVDPQAPGGPVRFGRRKA